MTDEHHKVMGHTGLPPITDLSGSPSNGRSNTSLSQNTYRPSSASSESTIVTMLPHSLKSSDPNAVNSKVSFLEDSRASSKTSAYSRESTKSPSLPHVKIVGTATNAKSDVTKNTENVVKQHDKIHHTGAKKKNKK